MLSARSVIFRQERVYQRAVALALGEVFTFARHTLTPVPMSLGLVDQDWCSWYRLLSAGRLQGLRASAILWAATWAHVAADEVCVLAGEECRHRGVVDGWRVRAG